jgi:hypothetical protein
MKWIVKDVDAYMQAKEYVDTALVPLVPLACTNMKAFVEMSEHVSLIANELERQFKGRVMLLPPFTYWIDEEKEALQQRLHRWKEELEQNGFRHVFYLAAHAIWQEDSLIYLPPLPLEHVDDHYKQKLVSKQVEQTMEMFIAKWTEKN